MWLEKGRSFFLLQIEFNDLAIEANGITGKRRSV